MVCSLLPVWRILSEVGMNIKLLKELYKQAETECGWSEEKFAELIVRECIDTVSDCSIEYCTRPQIVSEIREHFGVEE